LPCLPGLAAA